MKILDSNKKFFWIILISLCYAISASDELSQDTSNEEPEEIAWSDPDEEQELKVLPTKPIETESGTEERIGLTLNLPFIGNVICYAEIDPQTGEDILKADLPGKSINLSPIPIYFDNFELIIPSGKNPSVNATVTLFGKKAKLELIESKKTTAFTETPIKTNVGETVDSLNAQMSLLKFRLTFDEKPSFTFFPGKSVDLNHVDLILELGKKFPALATEINMFGQPVNLQFGFTTESSTVDFLIPSTHFANIIPFVKNTPLANAQLKTVIISAKYLYAKKSAKDKPVAKNTDEKDTEQELEKAAESTNIGSSNNLALAISAEADFSGILDDNLKKNINLNNLTVNATYSQAQGFRLESAVNNFGVPLVGNVSQAKFIIDWSENKEEAKETAEIKEAENQAEIPKLIEGAEASKQVTANEDSKAIVPVKLFETTTAESADKEKGPQLTITLTGNGSFDIPISGLGELNYSLSAAYLNKEFVFGGKINESFSFGSINIASEAEFIANVSNKSVTILGNTNFNGLDLIAKLMIAPDEKTKEMNVSVTAIAKATDWKPLANLKAVNFLPDQLKDLTIKNLDASFVTEKKSGKNITFNLVVKGLTNIMNIDVNAQVNFIKNDNQTGLFIKADVPNDELPSILENMQIKDAALVLSTIDYDDIDPLTKTKVKYKKGLNLAGEFDFTRDLKVIGDLLHLDHLNIVGVLDPSDIRKSQFSIQLPGIINTGTDVISFGPLSLEITGLPSFALTAEVTIRPDKNQSLDFKGSAGVKTAAIAFDLSMYGLWTNPFNLISDNFAVGNGHVGFSFTPLPAPPYISISSFAFGGETQLSKTQDIKFALSIDIKNPTNLALLGQLDGRLTLEEFVSFIVCKVINQKMNLANVPDISMEDIKISFAPMTTQVGPLEIEQGITLKGLITLFGKQVIVDFEVKSTGAKAQADMSPIDLGPLKISSGITAKGEKRETKLGGPSIDIELSTARQQFLITGLLELQYLFSVSTDIMISRSGIDFNFETNIGPDKLDLFMAKVKGHSSGPLSNPDFNLHMQMEQNFVKFIRDQVTAGLNIAQKQIQDKINSAIKDVNTIDKQINDAKTGIAKANNNIKQWKNKIKTLDDQINAKKKELDYYKSKISGGSIWDDIGDKFKGVGNRIGNIANTTKKGLSDLGNEAIDKAKNLVNKGVDQAKKQADNVVSGAKIIQLGTEITALQAAKESALLTLKGFEQVLDKVAKPIATGTLAASKRAAIGFLNRVKTGTVQILKTGELTVKSFADGFNVQKIVFDGSLMKIENGQLPGMLFVITILGSEKNIEFNFDFKDVKKSARNLAQYIVKKIVPGM